MLVFAVTRVIWVPSGEFVAYGTLTLAGLQLGKPPGTVGLLVGMAVVAGVDGSRGAACGAARRGGCRGSSRCGPGVPLAIAGAGLVARAAASCRFSVQILLTLALVTALGPLLYRIAYQPLAEASVLVLLIVSVARALRADRARAVVLRRRRLAHAGRSRRRRSTSAASTSACRACSSSRTSLALIGALYLFFGRTLYGKALRATAVNRVGARLVGISPDLRRRADVHAGGAAVRVLRRADRADHDRLLRLRLPGRASRASSARSSAASSSYPLAAAGALLVGLHRGVLVVLGERVQGSDRLHADHSRCCCGAA